METIRAASSVSLNTRRNTVTEKTFGAMAGLLVEGEHGGGGAAVGRTRPGGNRAGSKIFNSRDFRSRDSRHLLVI